jgi:hypothetical protein
MYIYNIYSSLILLDDDMVFALFPKWVYTLLNLRRPMRELMKEPRPSRVRGTLIMGGLLWVSYMYIKLSACIPHIFVCVYIPHE